MADRSFTTTLGLGVVGAGLAATAGHRDWVSLSTSDSAQAAADWFWQNNPGIGQMPLFGALGLVALACWGVLLVSRGAWRRVVAGVGLVVGLGLAATWISGLVTLRDDVESHVGDAELAPGWTVAWTPWFFVAGVAALLLVVAGVLALVRVPHWPTMGTRYDSPVAKPSATESVEVEVDLSEADPTDVWKAIDEGRDPTR